MDDAGIIADLHQRLARAERALAAASRGANSERLSFLLRLSDALRVLDREADIRSVALGILGHELGAGRAGLAEVTAGGEAVLVTATYTDGMPDLRGSYRLDDFGRSLAARMRAGEVFAHPDVADDARLSDAEKCAYAALGVAATVSVPIRDAEALLAVFFVHHAEPRDFAPAEIDLLRETAERTWLAIANARSRAALRASEARLAAAFESVPAGVAVLDVDGRIVVANSEYRRFLPSGVIPSRDPERGWRWRAWDEAGEPLGEDRYPGARAIRGERVVPGQEMLYRADDGREIWARVAGVPITDDAGRITGMASVISDIDALKRGAVALRETRVRAEQLIEGIAAAAWEARPDGVIEVDSPSWRAFTGQSLAEWRGYGWLDAIHPDDRVSTLQRWQSALRERAGLDAEYRLRTRDGGYRWVSVRAVPLIGDDGRVSKWLGMNIDIDARKRLEHQQRGHQRRTAALIEGVPQLLWRAVRAGEWTWASPQWTRVTGQPTEQSHGAGWLEMFHPEDRLAAVEAWAGAGAGGAFEIEHRLLHADGRYRWFSTRAVPVRDDGGQVLEWLGTSSDVHALHQARERQAVLLDELQHRTRNLIAVVGALATRTMDEAEGLADFSDRFGTRLAALSRVQGLLSGRAGDGAIDFAALLHAELLAHGAIDPEGRGTRATLAGPAGVRLPPRAVQVLALAIHELATNAVKHGALRGDDGRLTVSWRVADDHRLHIDWREAWDAPRPPGADGPGKGAGRTLIERSLPYQLGAATTYRLTAAGLTCTIDLPLYGRGRE